MNPRLTRQELLRRGAAGGALLAFPSLLAACGGGGGGETTAGRRAQRRSQLRELAVLHRHEGVLNAQGVSGPTTLEQFKTQTGIKVNYYRDHRLERRVLREDPGPLCAGQRHRPRHLRRDGQLAVPRASTSPRGTSRSSTRASSRTSRTSIDAQTSPGFDPNREYSLPWFTGIDGIAWNEEHHRRPGHEHHPALHRSEAQGQGDGARRDGRHRRARAARERRRPCEGHATRRSTARSRAIQTAVDSGQILKFTGNDYGPPLVRGDFAACIAWSGDLAQLVLDNENLHWAVPEKGGIIWTDNMFIPLGGSVPTASTYMNFVYDPKIAAQIALGNGLHLVGEGGEGRGGQVRIPRRARTSSSSRPTRRSRSCTRTTRRWSRTPTTSRPGSR